jgi:hypothetical protein
MMREECDGTIKESFIERVAADLIAPIQRARQPEPHSAHPA